MIFLPYVCSVQIEKNRENVANFVKEVPNLPRWAEFFIAVGSTNNNCYPVETKIGPAITWISEEQTDKEERLTIHSYLGERHESAHIDLESVNGGTQLYFQIHLPSEWPREKTNLQLQQLQRELQTLKGLLEDEN
jgi:uncharacterized membrane protein